MTDACLQTANSARVDTAVFSLLTFDRIIFHQQLVDAFPAICQNDEREMHHEFRTSKLRFTKVELFPESQ